MLEDIESQHPKVSDNKQIDQWLILKIMQVNEYFSSWTRFVPRSSQY